MLVTKMEIVDTTPYCYRDAVPVYALVRAHWLDTSDGQWNEGTVDVLVFRDGVCACHTDFEGPQYDGIDDAYEHFIWSSGWASICGVDWHYCYSVSAREMRHDGSTRSEYVWLAEIGQWVALYGEELATDDARLSEAFWRLRNDRVLAWQDAHPGE